MTAIESIWTPSCTTSGCLKCSYCQKRNENAQCMTSGKEAAVQLYAAEVQAYYFHYQVKNERKEIVY